MVNPTLPPPLPLPPDLIEAILLKLSVKTLMRLKCVCKSWLSFISDPNFAKSHYDHAAEPIHRFLFISTSGSEVHSIDIEASLDHFDHSSLSNHILPHPLPGHQFDNSLYNSILIYGSCRGFLLLDHGHRNLIVWNPSTGVHKPISYPNVKFLYESLSGFGYDASTDDYLVILMSKPKIRSHSSDWKSDIGIFSLKTNSWDQIKCVKFPYRGFHPITDAGLLLNGALHWLVNTCDAHVLVIIAFDMIERSLLEIPLPSGIDNKLLPFHFRGLYLRVLGDCLCLCYTYGRMAEIWMMKDYKVHSSWTKSFVLLTDNIPGNFFRPMCFTKSEGLFGSNCGGSLVKFNSQGVLTEHATCRIKSFKPDLLQFAVYRESLLSLPPLSLWGTK